MGKLVRPHADVTQICAIFSLSAQRYFGLQNALQTSHFKNILTTVFNFTRPLGVSHQKKIVFRLPSIIDTIYGNAWGEPALRVTVFSYHWRVVYLFSEGFRVQDNATILHVGCAFLKKLMKL